MKEYPVLLRRFSTVTLVALLCTSSASADRLIQEIQLDHNPDHNDRPLVAVADGSAFTLHEDGWGHMTLTRVDADSITWEGEINLNSMRRGAGLSMTVLGNEVLIFWNSYNAESLSSGISYQAFSSETGTPSTDAHELARFPSASYIYEIRAITDENHLWLTYTSPSNSGYPVNVYVLAAEATPLDDPYFRINVLTHRRVNEHDQSVSRDTKLRLLQTDAETWLTWSTYDGIYVAPFNVNGIQTHSVTKLSLIGLYVYQHNYDLGWVPHENYALMAKYAEPDPWTGVLETAVIRRTETGFEVSEWLRIAPIESSYGPRYLYLAHDPTSRLTRLLWTDYIDGDYPLVAQRLFSDGTADRPPFGVRSDSDAGIGLAVVSRGAALITSSRDLGTTLLHVELTP